MSRVGSDERPRVESTLLVARMIVGSLAAGLLLLTLAAALVELDVGFEALTAPAALLGLVSPVLGYRLYLSQREGTPRAADRESCRARFLRATVVALAVTDGIALFGVVAFLLGAGPFALVGVPMHLLLSGALWPSEDKLARFLEQAGPSRVSG